MHVMKRDGRREPVMFDKITARIRRLCWGLDDHYIDPVLVAQKVRFSVHAWKTRFVWFRSLACPTYVLVGELDASKTRDRAYFCSSQNIGVLDAYASVLRTNGIFMFEVEAQSSTQFGSPLRTLAANQHPKHTQDVLVVLEVNRRRPTRLLLHARPRITNPTPPRPNLSHANTLTSCVNCTPHPPLAAHDPRLPSLKIPDYEYWRRWCREFTVALRLGSWTRLRRRHART